MDMIAESLADPNTRRVYLGFCLALVALPLLAMWLWYRSRAKAGTVDRAMTVRVSVFSLLWFAANAVALGILMWADGVNGIEG